jgi:ABC-type transporter Mla MlaB component
VTLDFSGVTRADSAALSLILHWMRLRRTRPATLALKAVPEQLRALARTSRMEQYLDG